MIISHTLKIIFIHVQRTGGSTLINLLKSELGSDLEILSQHGNARTSESYLLEKYADYYTFGFTRNPWERILSWYSLIHRNDPKNLDQERKRFETFIESDWASDFTTQQFHYNTLDYFSNNKGLIKADKIFRYENFETEIRSLFNKFNFPLKEIPKINNTNPKIFQNFYTKKSQNLIAEKCKKDIEYFNYVF